MLRLLRLPLSPFFLLTIHCLALTALLVNVALFSLPASRPSRRELYSLTVADGSLKNIHSIIWDKVTALAEIPFMSGLPRFRSPASMCVTHGDKQPKQALEMMHHSKHSTHLT